MTPNGKKNTLKSIYGSKAKPLWFVPLSHVILLCTKTITNLETYHLRTLAQRGLIVLWAVPGLWCQRVFISVHTVWSPLFTQNSSLCISKCLLQCLLWHKKLASFTSYACRSRIHSVAVVSHSHLESIPKETRDKGVGGGICRRREPDFKKGV